MGKELNPATYHMALRMALPAAQSVDLSSPRIHQKGVVVARQMDDRREDWREERGRCPAVEQLAYNMNQEEPWEAG
jgi:hypothetical protein